MEISLIESEDQYDRYLERIDALLNENPDPTSPSGKQLKHLLLLVRTYEEENYPIPLPEPIEAIKQKMTELGLKNKDLADAIGSKSYISSILNRRKPLTLEIARKLHKSLHIPAEVLLQ
jgi:HTH-type transcriptional regulator/antitoxin HigA